MSAETDNSGFQQICVGEGCHALPHCRISNSVLLRRDVGPSIGSPTKLRRGQSVRRPVNEFSVGADRCVRP